MNKKIISLSIKKSDLEAKKSEKQFFSFIEDLLWTNGSWPTFLIRRLCTHDDQAKNYIIKKIIKIGQEDNMKALKLSQRIFNCSYIEWLLDEKDFEGQDRRKIRELQFRKLTS